MPRKVGIETDYTNKSRYGDRLYQEKQVWRRTIPRKVGIETDYTKKSRYGVGLYQEKQVQRQTIPRKVGMETDYSKKSRYGDGLYQEKYLWRRTIPRKVGMETDYTKKRSCTGPQSYTSPGILGLVIFMSTIYTLRYRLYYYRYLAAARSRCTGWYTFIPNRYYTHQSSLDNSGYRWG